MVQANIHEAKTQLSKLIERAEAGEDVVIARHGKPIVRLQRIEEASRRPREWIGMFAHKMKRTPTWAEWQASDRVVAAEFGVAYVIDAGDDQSK